MSIPTDWLLEPLSGAGPIRFDLGYSDVAELLGEPDQPLAKVWGGGAQRAGWAGGVVAVHFSEPESLSSIEYIEFSSSGGIRPLLYGMCPFELPADEVLAALAREGLAYDESDPELGYSYVYNEAEISLWRPVLPEDDDDDAGRFFATVGVGRRGYYE